MARLPLNKSSLKHERNRLATYARFLPSLDLKRRQLMWELRRAERELAEIEVEIARLVESAQDVFRSGRKCGHEAYGIGTSASS